MTRKQAEAQAARLLSKADAYVKGISTAFLQVVDEIRNNLINIKEVEAALSQGNEQAILDSLHVRKMDDLLFGAGMKQDAFVFTNVYRNAFFDGAMVAISNLPADLQKLIRFDPLGERAVNILRTRGATLARELTASTEAGVRQALVNLTLQNATIPERARAIKQLIGLTSDQMKAVLNFRLQLETRQVLGVTVPSDRRLNAIEAAMVRRHMREGHFSQSQIDAMVDTYYQRLLRKRANDIARTESLNAVNSGQLELWEQGLDQGIFKDNEDRKYWIVTRDDRLRKTHAAIPSMNPQGVKIRSFFVTPFGTVSGPGDANIGLINCRCTLVMGQINNSSWYDKEI